MAVVGRGHALKSVLKFFSKLSELLLGVALKATFHLPLHVPFLLAFSFLCQEQGKISFSISCM
jgi:hypothetical protein